LKFVTIQFYPVSCYFCCLRYKDPC